MCRDRILAVGKCEAQADRHAQTMSEKTRHTSCIDREGIQHQLLQRLQVHPATQGREIKEAEGRIRQAVLRAWSGV